MKTFMLCSTLLLLVSCGGGQGEMTINPPVVPISETTLPVVSPGDTEMSGSLTTDILDSSQPPSPQQSGTRR